MESWNQGYWFSIAPKKGGTFSSAKNVSDQKKRRLGSHAITAISQVRKEKIGDQSPIRVYL